METVICPLSCAFLYHILITIVRLVSALFECVCASSFMSYDGMNVYFGRYDEEDKTRRLFHVALGQCAFMLPCNL